jgi:hypothetical protein
VVKELLELNSCVPSIDLLHQPFACDKCKGNP